MGEVKFESLSDRKVWRRAMLHLKKRDRALGRIIDGIGEIKFEWHWEPYEAIIRSFIYQQISGSAGDSILKKFEGMFGGRLPTPKEFLRAPERRVRAAGISPQKYSYIKNLCERLESEELDLTGLARLPDEEVIAILDDLKGVGRWTAEMFLMSSLRMVDVFAADDLGLKNAVRRVYKLRKDPSRATLDKITGRWRPYRSIAAIYLWRSTDGIKRKK